MLLEAGSKAGLAANLASFAGLALARGQVTRSVRLFAAIENILQSLSWRLPPADDEMYEQNLTLARQQLSPATFEINWSEGSAFDLDEAIEYALGPRID